MTQEPAAAAAPAEQAPAAKPQKLTMAVMSGDMDKLFGAFTIATGAAAMGMDVTMFFTFWGLRAITKSTRSAKGLYGRMLAIMYGGDITKAHPSKFKFGFLGRWLFNRMMKQKNVASLERLRDMAAEAGVKMHGCTTSMAVMEIAESDFIDEAGECVGVGYFLAEAADSDIQLFI